MPSISQIVTTASDAVWGPLTLLLIATGLILSIRTHFIQFRKLPLGVDILRGRYDDPRQKGDVSHFQALSTALAATIGTGNIVGVATAIAIGGPGAVFWMWLTALVGMATKYSSCLLALRFRTFDKEGKAIGGPMYYLEKGLGLKKPAQFFSICTVITALVIGNLVQSHSATDYLFTSFHAPKMLSAVFLTILVALVIIGGIHRIAQVTSRLVPFMCVFYVLACLTVLLLNISQLPGAFALIFKHAFTPTGATGGFLGSGILMTIRMGVARGVFSNESGLGSAPIAHAAAKTKEPVREGLVAMTGPFIDTLIVCTMTALVIVITGAWSSGLNGAPLSAAAFRMSLFGWGDKVVALALALFAYSSILGWFYYGDRALSYLTQGRGQTLYKWIWTLVIPIGAMIKLELIWGLADIVNGLMALPNLIGLVLLSGLVAKETRSYFSRVHKVTPLVGLHEKMGAKMVDFHGWYLPMQFKGILAEHQAVRNRAGLFDASHLGKVRVMGPEALSFVQKLVSGDVSKLKRGQILYTLITNEKGKILDDILVYCYSSDHFRLVVNAANHPLLKKWFLKHKVSGVQITDESRHLALLAIQGPKAVQALAPFLNPSFKKLENYTFESNTFQGLKKRIPISVSRTGYTGEDGFELFTLAQDASFIAQQLFDASISVIPCGLGARDTLRLEAGNLLSGQDFDHTVTPFEVGLGFAVDLEKTDFIGKQALVRQKQKGVQKRVIGFLMNDRTIPRTGSRVELNGVDIGRVTSGSFSPLLKKPIGMAQIEAEKLEIGTEIKILVRGKIADAQVASRVFYRKKQLLKKSTLPNTHA
jgi:alanine or glycine:cation symporter, AGCS family